MNPILAVFLGGGLGALIRYLIGRGVLTIYQGSFPLGTIFANLISCILVAVVVYFLQAKIEISKNLSLFLIVGFCGGLSTFSTFSYETLELLKQGFALTAILNVVLSLLIGIGAMFIIYYKSTN